VIVSITILFDALLGTLSYTSYGFFTTVICIVHCTCVQYTNKANIRNQVLYAIGARLSAAAGLNQTALLNNHDFSCKV